MADDEQQGSKPPEGVKGSIAINNQGLVVASNHEEIWRTVCMWHKSGLCPESFAGPAQVFFAHQTLASLGVNPLTYLRNCAYIKNSLVVFGDLPLALVNLSGKLAQPPKEFFVDKDYAEICVANRNVGASVFAAVCQMWPASAHNQMQERAYTFADAEVAGKLPARAPSPWKLYPNRMLQMKARGWLIKDLFPEVLNGVPQGEYDHDTIGATPNIKRIEIVGKSDDDLNAAYGAE